MARQPFNTRWAQGVETEDSLFTFRAPGDVRLGTGWEGGQDKDAPPAGHENWWHNRVDSALQGVERNGVMGWHPLTPYGLGAPTYANDGNYYESLAAANVGNDPISSSGFWRYCGPSFFTGHEPGDLKMVAHNNVPSAGWLKCNGAVLARASYQRLFAMIGTAHNTGGEASLQFRLPDYRGEFVRGFSDGSSVDSGRVFGSAQGQQLEDHRHTSARSLLSNAASGPNGNTVLGAADTIGVILPSSLPTSGSHGSETRPRNKTANYWIKY